MSAALEEIIITSDSSTWTIKQDSITDREYYYLNSNEQLGNLISLHSINISQILLASFNGQIRFLLNGETLVIVEGQTLAQMQDYFLNNVTSNMTFYLGDGHAAIGFNCSQCDESKPHSKFYHLLSKVEMSDTIPFDSFSMISMMIGPNITFSLNAAQENTVFLPLRIFIMKVRMAIINI